jgi:hypothetical protein
MEPTTQSGGTWQPADQPPAPGWWKASDGQWYPPTQAPAQWTPPASQANQYPSGPMPGGAPYYPPGAQPQTWAPLYPEQKSSGNGFSITAIVLGAIAFLIVPPLFGVAGLIFGGIGLSRKEKLAPIGMIVSGLGLVLGFVLGAIVAGVLRR